MDTNLNILPQKKVVSVEIRHLDKLGYGPQGKHTRREWRKECLDNLRSGKEQFEKWQESLQIKAKIKKVSFRNEYSSESSKVYFPFENHLPYSLDFSGHTFFDVLDCSGYLFKYPVLFCDVHFRKQVNFKDTTFNDLINLQAVIFSSFVYFNNANFNQDALFVHTRFNWRASFFKSKFKNKCDFRYAVFNNTSNFENCEIQNVGHFEYAKFNHEMPNFLGVDNAKTLLVFSGDDFFNKKSIKAHTIDQAAHLKRLSEEQGQIDQTLMFNAFELIGKAKQRKIDFGLVVVTFLYRIFSNFGRSYSRPLAAYVSLFLITLCIGLYSAAIEVPDGNKCNSDFIFKKVDLLELPCLIYAKKFENGVELDGYRAAFEFAAYRGSGIIDFSDNDKQTAAVSQRVFGQPIEPGWARAWGIFKAIASTVLLFLAALGLRNKYRIK